MQSGITLPATTCLCSAGSLGVDAERSYRLLRCSLERSNGGGVEVRRWSLTVLAEMATRLGLSADAEEHFRAALALEGRDSYLLGAYADFLLDQKRPEEVIEILKGEDPVHDLLLRRALAQGELDQSSFALRETIKALEGRYGQLDIGASVITAGPKRAFSFI